MTFLMRLTAYNCFWDIVAEVFPDAVVPLADGIYWIADSN